jgi:hypothetical protein
MAAGAFLTLVRSSNRKIDVLAGIRVSSGAENVLKLEHGKGEEFHAAGTCEPEDAR